MARTDEFVAACESLAEVFEQAGRTDLSALADLSAYWLSGGDGIDVISISEVVASCRETLGSSFESSDSLEQFITRTEEDVLANLQNIEAVISYSATSRDRDELIERAARLQAVAILTSSFFQRSDK